MDAVAVVVVVAEIDVVAGLLRWAWRLYHEKRLCDSHVPMTLGEIQSFLPMIFRNEAIHFFSRVRVGIYLYESVYVCAPCMSSVIDERD